MVILKCLYFKFAAHKICTMYENATKLEPNNEELLSQLFMSYVRIGAYKKQQTAAMALYKAKAKTPYYFWAVMSVVLQAKTSNEEKTANQVILPLAERMISKMNKVISDFNLKFFLNIYISMFKLFF